MRLSAFYSRFSASALLVLVAACSRAPKPQLPTAQGPAAASATAAPPSTDIYLYRLGRSLIPFRNRLSNITNRPGYDNQPSWDGNRRLLYTSIQGGQADIYQLDFETSAIGRVTATPESEYSAAITPDGKAISVVRVELDSTQRLWRFPKDGSAPSVVLQNIKPVGYYAWLDTATLALFVLGTPNTLQIADARTGTASVVTTNIGRSLQRVPGGRRASYVHRVGTRWVLETVDPAPRNGAFDIDTIAVLPDSADYVVWRSPTELYTAAASRIFRMRRPSKSWEQIADLSEHGIHRISRLALKPDGTRLAIVAEEVRKPDD
jgi:WD40 repeat protein